MTIDVHPATALLFSLTLSLKPQCRERFLLGLGARQTGYSRSADGQEIANFMAESTSKKNPN